MDAKGFRLPYVPPEAAGKGPPGGRGHELGKEKERKKGIVRLGGRVSQSGQVWVLETVGRRRARS
jgi:hypothetical protein